MPGISDLPEGMVIETIYMGLSLNRECRRKNYKIQGKDSDPFSLSHRWPVRPLSSSYVLADESIAAFLCPKPRRTTLKEDEMP